jgi:polyferredoxin
LRAKETGVEQGTSIGKYILLFAAAHLGLLIGLGILTAILDIDSNTGVTVGALMGAAILAISKFIRDNKRLPNKKEKWKLVWFSCLASWAVSMLLFIVIVSLVGEGAEIMQAISTLGAPLLLGVIAFLTLFYVGALYLAYGFVANKQMEALQRKGEI